MMAGLVNGISVDLRSALDFVSTRLIVSPPITVTVVMAAATGACAAMTDSGAAAKLVDVAAVFTLTSAVLFKGFA